ncbi:N7 [macacine gammaherpesvirus 12]|uniref:N7 n=1 Tax=macacine gammaherpesvirus 12 TaxID=2560571 RepID=A0A0B5CYD1_9GAMA|nr:N7 [Macaca nemestrina rhadinovirus 2]AJE29654.1 N7 [Macaca nemestrina rhadinovirus 2]
MFKNNILKYANTKMPLFNCDSYTKNVGVVCNYVSKQYHFRAHETNISGEPGLSCHWPPTSPPVKEFCQDLLRSTARARWFDLRYTHWVLTTVAFGGRTFSGALAPLGFKRLTRYWL